MYAHGKEYEFPNMSESVFLDWANASSVGKYYNQYIRATYATGGALKYRTIKFRARRAATLRRYGKRVK